MKIKTNFCLALLLTIGSIAVAQCGRGPLRKSLVDWAQFHFDLCHTGHNPYEFLLDPITVANLGLEWSYTTGDLVYYALDANTGALLWSYTTGGPVESSPAVANGTVYVGSDDGNLYAFGLPKQ